MDSKITSKLAKHIDLEIRRKETISINLYCKQNFMIAVKINFFFSLGIKSILSMVFCYRSCVNRESKH